MKLLTLGLQKRRIFNMKQLIYLDNAATKTRPEVVEAMLHTSRSFMAILPRSMNFPQRARRR